MDYPMNATESARPKPRLCLNDFDLPEIKDAKIGATMKLEVEVKITELSQRGYDTADRKNTVHADLTVLSIKKGGE